MKRRNFRLVYMIPRGTEEFVKTRIVRTFQNNLTFDQIKKIVFENVNAIGCFLLEFEHIGDDDV